MEGFAYVAVDNASLCRGRRCEQDYRRLAERDLHRHGVASQAHGRSDVIGVHSEQMPPVSLGVVRAGHRILEPGSHQRGR